MNPEPQVNHSLLFPSDPEELWPEFCSDLVEKGFVVTFLGLLDPDSEQYVDTDEPKEEQAVHLSLQRDGIITEFFFEREQLTWDIEGFNVADELEQSFEFELANMNEEEAKTHDD